MPLGRPSRMAVAISSISAAPGAAPARAAEGGFSAGRFTCLQYANGLGSSAAGRTQSALARIWMHGYLIGYYKKQGKLTHDAEPRTVDRFENALLQTCREFYQDSIFTVSQQALVKTERALPDQATAEFAPVPMTCAQYTALKGGAAADATRAELADLWGFALVQGSKNVAQPDLEVPAEAKAQIMGAVARTCVAPARAETPYMDIVAAVADAIKLE